MNKKMPIPTITPQRLRLRKLKDLLLFLFPMAALWLLLFVIFFVSIVPSNSMAPAIPSGDIILGSRLVYKGEKSPAYGDIILFRKGGARMFKRVIGTPGDTVNLQNGHVYLNGKPLIEDYVMENSKTNPLRNKMTEFKVPAGCYFVLGDNRADSLDSRDWEQPYIYKDWIIGKIAYSGHLFPEQSQISIRDFKLNRVQSFSLVETASDLPPLETEAPEETISDKERFKKVEETVSPAETLPVQPITPGTRPDPPESESSTDSEDTLPSSGE